MDPLGPYRRSYWFDRYWLDRAADYLILALFIAAVIAALIVFGLLVDPGTDTGVGPGDAGGHWPAG